MRASADRPYAGYAESSGSLNLPASGVLDDVSTLLGGRTQVRVWWRAADDWRVDTLTPTGENDQYAVDIGTATWDSEDNRMSYGEADRGSGPVAAVAGCGAASSSPPVCSAGPPLIA